MTSHDVVARLRRILHTTKIGHSGTLDPNATGVLLVLIGKACKALPFLEDTDKEYIATLQLDGAAEESADTADYRFSIGSEQLSRCTEAGTTNDFQCPGERKKAL